MPDDPQPQFTAIGFTLSADEATEVWAQVELLRSPLRLKAPLLHRLRAGLINGPDDARYLLIDGDVGLPDRRLVVPVSSQAAAELFWPLAQTVMTSGLIGQVVSADPEMTAQLAKLLQLTLFNATGQEPPGGVDAILDDIDYREDPDD